MSFESVRLRIRVLNLCIYAQSDHPSELFASLCFILILALTPESRGHFKTAQEHGLLFDAEILFLSKHVFLLGLRSLR